jgi:multimeric flavodoxin WrbA
MNEKPVIIIKASPRKNGNSGRLADHVAAGLTSSGQPLEIIEIGELNILPCNGCGDCQNVSEITCTLQDDMTPLYPRLAEASGLVIACPIYYFSVNGIAKNFIDRAFYPFNTLNGNLWAGKPLAAVLAYADDDPFLSGAVNALRMYQDIARHVQMQWAGAVYSTTWDPDEIGKQPDVLRTAFELGQKIAKMAA